MRDLLGDIRYAGRLLARSPGFTIVAVLTLALGIGANSTLFSIVNAVLLKPLPFPNPGRILSVTLTTQRGIFNGGPGAPHWAYYAWRDRARSVANLAAYQRTDANVEGRTSPERLRGTAVTGDFFGLLGARPALGAAFAGAELDPTAPGPRSVLLSHAAWVRLFAGDTAIVGRTIPYNGSPAIVDGVMPATFDFPHGTEFWTPLRLRIVTGGGGYATYFLSVIGRLAPGASLERAKSELAGLWRQDQAQFGGPEWRDAKLDVVSLHERLFGDLRPLLLLLSGAVALVLLIACANMASMLLARAAAREREFAIRAAIGAGRSRVVRQVLVESVLLSLLGGGAGLVLAGWGGELFAALAPRMVAGAPPIGTDAAVLAFTAAVAIGTGIVFGVAPALSASRLNLVEALKGVGSGVRRGGERARLRRLLVVGQLSAALVLLIGAALVARSLLHLLAVDPGFRPQGVVAADVNLSRSRYQTTAAANAFYEALLDRVSRAPGVQSAALVDAPPLEGFSRGYSFRLDGAPYVQGADQMANLNAVTPAYFRTVGATLVRGRAFDSVDVVGAPSVAVVNEAFARRFLGGNDPVGHTILLPDTALHSPHRIVGEIRDIRQVGRDTPAEPEIFLVAAQSTYMPGSLVARTVAGRGAMGAAIRQAVRAIDPSLPVARLYWLRDELAQGAAPRRANAVLLGLFAVLAAAISGMGLYGLTAFVVAQRTREVGLRVALGAARGDVLRLVVGQGAILIGGGVVLGLAVALALARVLRSMLFGIAPDDPATFAAAALLLTAVALLATYLPARRALAVDPLVALRAE